MKRKKLSFLVLHRQLFSSTSIARIRSLLLSSKSPSRASRSAFSLRLISRFICRCEVELAWAKVSLTTLYHGWLIAKVGNRRSNYPVDSIGFLTGGWWEGWKTLIFLHENEPKNSFFSFFLLLVDFSCNFDFLYFSSFSVSPPLPLLLLRFIEPLAGCISSFI